jgi:hypothetical protein
MVEALSYKPEGCGFESRLSHCIFFNLPEFPGLTMTLGFTQTVTEMSTSRSRWVQSAVGA